MCVGIPMQVVEAAGEQRARGATGRDGRALIDMALVGPAGRPAPGSSPSWARPAR